MPTSPIYIFGAGGHAKVVIAAALANEPLEIRVIDDDPAKLGSRVLGHVVSSPEVLKGKSEFAFHVAIGNCRAREAVSQILRTAGGKLQTVSHPSACLAENAEVGDGAFLAAGCVIAPDTRLGEGVIVNHNAVVDHDCRVGTYAHIAPGVVLGGGVQIGDRVLVGANSTVLPGVQIGAEAVIGAGSTVIRDVCDGARIIMAITHKS